MEKINIDIDLVVTAYKEKLSAITDELIMMTAYARQLESQLKENKDNGETL